MCCCTYYICKYQICPFIDSWVYFGQNIFTSVCYFFIHYIQVTLSHLLYGYSAVKRKRSPLKWQIPQRLQSWALKLRGAVPDVPTSIRLPLQASFWCLYVPPPVISSLRANAATAAVSIRRISKAVYSCSKKYSQKHCKMFLCPQHPLNSYF